MYSMAPATTLNNMYQSPPDNFQQLFIQQPATLPFTSLKTKRQEKPNLHRSNKTFLMFNQSFREVHQARQERITIPRQRNQMKATPRWRKGNFFTLQSAQMHFQLLCDSSALHLTIPSRERGRQRAPGQNPSHEIQLSRTQTNHRMTKALKPKDNKKKNHWKKWPKP